MVCRLVVSGFTTVIFANVIIFSVVKVVLRVVIVLLIFVVAQVVRLGRCFGVIVGLSLKTREQREFFSDKPQNTNGRKASHTYRCSFLVLVPVDLALGLLLGCKGDGDGPV